MEHQTNTFMSRASSPLMAHELGHQWFGDKVTCGSWRDIWLNEGFATYLQLLYDERLNPGYLRQALRNTANTITSSPGGSVRVNDTTLVSRIFDGRLSYSKGAYLLHMLRWKLGDSLFFKSIRQYVNDPVVAYNFALTEDLQRNLEQVSGKNLSSFFQKWFHGEGYPSYSVQWAQDSLNTAHITINQSTSHPSVSFYDMPVPIQFKNASRDTILVFEHVQNAESFLADVGFRADSVVFDPYYWILSRNNIIDQVDCMSVTNKDMLPFYEVEWMQNSNNWVKLNVRQTNENANAAAENLPILLHFAANGKDTVITIRNIHNNRDSWINIGFKATNVFTSSPSCFLENAYNIRSKVSSSVQNDIKIFPNPALDKAFISLRNPTDKTLSIELFNTAGQLVYHRQTETEGFDDLIEIPTYSLPKGIYVLKLRSEKNINVVKKLLKSN